jgi:orotate phosphoribosyltransferase
MVTDLNEIIRSNMIQGDAVRYLDFWRMMSNPENMVILGNEFQKKLEVPTVYDITAAIDDEGIVLSTIIGKRIGVGMCKAYSKYFSEGDFAYCTSPKDGVKNKNVLLTTGEITDGYKHLKSAKRIIFNGGNPKAIATIIDYDIREGKTAKERMLKYLRTEKHMEDIDVISLVKESDLKL